jgi:hypothetical protein
MMKGREGREGERERKGPEETCFYMLNDEKENENLKEKKFFQAYT